MKNEIANSPAARKQYIESWVDKLYDILEKKNMLYLFPEPITQFKQYALDMFLDTNLSYEQIADNFGKLLSERQKTYLEKKKTEEKEAYDNNIEAVVEETPQNELPKEPAIEIQTNNFQTIEPVVAATYKPVEPIIVEDTQNKIIEPIQIGEEKHDIEKGPVTSDELNTMINDSISEQIEIVEKENTNQKQYIKKSEKQSGVISIFNIVLVILGIAAFVLIAMILNLLLK